MFEWNWKHIYLLEIGKDNSKSIFQPATCLFTWVLNSIHLSLVHLNNVGVPPFNKDLERSIGLVLSTDANQCHLVSSSGWHFFQHHHHRPCSHSPPLTWNITQNQRKGRTIEIQTMLKRADLGRQHPPTQTTTSHLYPDMSWKGLWRLELQNWLPNLGLLGSLLERSNNFQQPSHVCERQQKLFWKEGDLHFAARCIISLSLSNLHCFMSSDYPVLTSHRKIDPLLPSTGLTKMTPKNVWADWNTKRDFWLYIKFQIMHMCIYIYTPTLFLWGNHLVYLLWPRNKQGHCPNGPKNFL